MMHEPAEPKPIAPTESFASVANKLERHAFEPYNDDDKIVIKPGSNFTPFSVPLQRPLGAGIMFPKSQTRVGALPLVGDFSAIQHTAFMHVPDTLIPEPPDAWNDIFEYVANAFYGALQLSAGQSTAVYLKELAEQMILYTDSKARHTSGAASPTAAPLPASADEDDVHAHEERVFVPIENSQFRVQIVRLNRDQSNGFHLTRPIDGTWIMIVVTGTDPTTEESMTEFFHEQGACTLDDGITPSTYLQLRFGATYANSIQALLWSRSVCQTLEYALLHSEEEPEQATKVPIPDFDPAHDTPHSFIQQFARNTSRRFESSSLTVLQTHLFETMPHKQAKFDGKEMFVKYLDMCYDVNILNCKMLHDMDNYGILCSFRFIVGPEQVCGFKLDQPHTHPKKKSKKNMPEYHHQVMKLGDPTLPAVPPTAATKRFYWGPPNRQRASPTQAVTNVPRVWAIGIDSVYRGPSDIGFLKDNDILPVANLQYQTRININMDVLFLPSFTEEDNIGIGTKYTIRPEHEAAAKESMWKVVHLEHPVVPFIHNCASNFQCQYRTPFSRIVIPVVYRDNSDMATKYCTVRTDVYNLAMDDFDRWCFAAGTFRSSAGAKPTRSESMGDDDHHTTTSIPHSPRRGGEEWQRASGASRLAQENAASGGGGGGGGGNNNNDDDDVDDDDDDEDEDEDLTMCTRVSATLAYPL